MRAGPDDPLDPLGSGTPEPSGFAVIVWSIVASVALILAAVAVVYGLPDRNRATADVARPAADLTPTGSLGDDPAEVVVMGTAGRADRTGTYGGQDFIADLSRLEVENAGLRQTVLAMRAQMDIMAERMARIEDRFTELTGSIDANRAPPPVAPPVAALSTIPDRDFAASTDGRAVAARQTRFGVELGTFTDLATLRAEWRRLLDAQPNLFADLEALATVRDRGGRTELLLVAGPFPSAAEAAARCTEVDAADLACLPAFFLGQPLEIR